MLPQPSSFVLTSGLRLFPSRGGADAIPRVLASADPAQLSAWAGRRDLQHGCRWAVNCALSNVVVIDIDNPASPDWKNYWPATLTTWSSRPGGRHHYFRQIEPRVGCGKLRPSKGDGDIKGDGGIVWLHDKWLDASATLLPFPEEHRPSAPLRAVDVPGFRRLVPRSEPLDTQPWQLVDAALRHRGWKYLRTAPGRDGVPNRRYQRPGPPSSKSGVIGGSLAVIHGVPYFKVWSESEQYTQLPSGRSLRPSELVAFWSMVE